MTEEANFERLQREAAQRVLEEAENFSPPPNWRALEAYQEYKRTGVLPSGVRGLAMEILAKFLELPGFSEFFEGLDEKAQSEFLDDFCEWLSLRL